MPLPVFGSKMLVHMVTVFLLTSLYEQADGSITEFLETPSTPKPKNAKETINKYADAIVARLKTHLIERGVEVLEVPGVGPLGVGEFTGLKSIRRLRDATLNRRNRTITLHTVLDENSKLTFPCSLTVFGRNVCNGRTTTFSLAGLTLGLVFQTRATPDGLPQLDICDVSDLGHMRIQFSEDQVVIFAPFISWMGKWLSTLFKSRLAHNLQDVLCNTVASNV